MKKILIFAIALFPILGFTQNECPSGTSSSVTGVWTDSSGVPHQNFCFSSVTGRLTLPFTNAITLYGSILFGGPAPWIDVTAPPYSAKCDGVTDDTAAFQSALTAVNSNSNGGGKVVIPAPYVNKTCVITSSLNMDQFENVTLESNNTEMGDLGNSWPRLKFTGNPATGLISARSSYGVTLRGLVIQYTNPSFTGRVIDLQHVGTGCGGGGCDSQFSIFERNLIEGTASAAGALCLICLDNADDIWISKNAFYWAVNAIQGPTSNQIVLFKNEFGKSDAATISNAYIKNPGNGWLVQSNDMEIGPSGTVSLVDCVNCGTLNFGVMEWEANWVGDATGTYSGTFFKSMGAGGTAGCAISAHGNYFGGNASAPNPFLANNNSAVCTYTFNGNLFANFSTLFGYGSGGPTSIWEVNGNSYTSITTFSSGGPVLTGRITDNTGATTFYGAAGQVFSNGNVTVNNTLFGGVFSPGAVLFTNLGALSNGAMRYCSDCTVANPCAGAGTGAIAKRLNGAWVCN